MLTRRHFIATGAAMFSAPIAAVPLNAAPRSPSSMWNKWDAQITPADFDLYTSNPWGLNPRFLPQLVKTHTGLTVGDVHVDAVARYVYHIREDNTAMRYGCAIARGNLYEPGVYTIKVKKKWPTWKPTKAMIEREPHKYKQYEDGMDAGPRNPLGSRALYLFTGNRDTYLRIHGSPNSRSIGGRASSGCVRMVMAHINHLYPSVQTGVRAHLHRTEDRLTPTA